MTRKHMMLKLNDGIKNTAPGLVKEVKLLQQVLKDWGVYPADESIDGEFGPKTEQAVKNFQSKRHLEVDGVVGQNTWAALLKVSPQEIEIIQVFSAPSGNLNARIEAAAKKLRGRDTSDCPVGGNLACAWVVNKVLNEASIATLGTDPDYVPSLVDALEGGRGQRVSRGQENPGDLVIAYDMRHIGICMGKGLVLSNSSSKARFTWESGIDFDGYYDGKPSDGIYRLIR